MKTPREILLFEHRDAEPRLNRIRERVLAEHLSEPAERIGLGWMRWFIPSRGWVIGLSCCWMVIIILNIASELPAASAMPRRWLDPSPEVLLQLQAQHQLRRELLEDSSDALSPMEAPRSQHHSLNRQPIA